MEGRFRSCKLFAILLYKYHFKNKNLLSSMSIFTFIPFFLIILFNKLGCILWSSEFILQMFKTYFFFFFSVCLPLLGFKGEWKTTGLSLLEVSVYRPSSAPPPRPRPSPYLSDFTLTFQSYEKAWGSSRLPFQRFCCFLITLILVVQLIIKKDKKVLQANYFFITIDDDNTVSFKHHLRENREPTLAHFAAFLTGIMELSR